jgi:DNA-binding phage protein
MAMKLDIAEQLRRAIARAEKKGLTRYRIARLASMTESQVKRVAEAVTCPRLDTAARLADAIGLRLALVEK